MTETKSLIPRVIGLILAALIFVAIVELIIPSIGQLTANTALTNQIISNSTFIPISNYTASGENPSTTLWGYRGIDSLLQGLLLVTAAIGAATLFRLEKGGEEKKKEG
jgi:multisubunit Na+/H+ antiporter MnhB subunit